MRKLLWIFVAVALVGGAYWSVAHATVHPRSPVGRALAWLGVKNATPTPVASVVHPPCPSITGCGEESAAPVICVEAHQPAGLIVVDTNFRPMTDPDGNAVDVPVVVRSERVREVVVSTEEFRLMPEVEPLETVETLPERPKEKAGECCPFGGSCPKADLKPCPCQENPAACKEGCKGCPCCPAGQPERIAEPPVEVETSEPARKPLSWLFAPLPPQAGPLAPLARPGICIDTMEMRPSDLICPVNRKKLD